MTEPFAPLEPLKITCTMADCEGDLHCFKFHSRKMTAEQRGACRYCKVELVDWDRVQARDAADVDHTMKALKHEFIRHHFWHTEIDQKAMDHAWRKGRVKLRDAAEIRLITSVGEADPKRDGRQTPFKDNVLFYAQHATACCCRACIEYWHAIPKGRELRPAELAYFTQLVMNYVQQRLPELPDEPQHVPRRRRAP